jgi:hypothetical protein
MFPIACLGTLKVSQAGSAFYEDIKRVNEPKISPFLSEAASHGLLEMERVDKCR